MCTLQRSNMSSFFKNYSLVEVIYLLITSNKYKSFLRSIKDTNRKCLIEQNTHITHRDKYNFRKGYLVLLVIPPFYNNPTILPTPRSFMGKFWTHPFSENFKNSTPTPYRGGGWDPTMFWWNILQLYEVLCSFCYNNWNSVFFSLP